MIRTFHKDNTSPAGKGWVFVFGSNLAGRHGAGAAKAAHVNFSAQYGIGSGPTGRAYAIPTKDRHLKSLSLDEIATHVANFISHATEHSDSKFFVTRVGCGLAGHKDSAVAPLFAMAPSNCSFAFEWAPYLDAALASEKQV